MTKHDLAVVVLVLMVAGGLCLGVILLPLMLGAFLEMLPYLLVLAVLWWLL